MKKTLIQVVLLWSCCGSLTFADVQFQKITLNGALKQPLYLTYTPNSADDLYVVEQTGRIQRLKPSSSGFEVSLYFDLTKASQFRLATGGEQGLLGFAFHPNFARQPYFYVNYTAASPKRTIISRFKVIDLSSNPVKVAKEEVLLSFKQDFSNHNGGMLAFGPDQKLYVGVGDGGSGGDPNNRAQDGQSLLGKLLRLDDQGQAAADNPFINDPEKRDEIWALGLRNPWRFSFDRVTGALWLADVGQNKIEEVNRIDKGGNYGWRFREGSQPYSRDSVPENLTLIPPVYEYDHSVGQSITGGYVYRGQKVPELTGKYIFGDFVSGRIWALDTETFAAKEIGRVPNPSSFGEDAQGDLFVVSYGGALYQVVDDDNDSR